MGLLAALGCPSGGALSVAALSDAAGVALAPGSGKAPGRLLEAGAGAVSAAAGPTDGSSAGPDKVR